MINRWIDGRASLFRPLVKVGGLTAAVVAALVVWGGHGNSAKAAGLTTHWYIGGIAVDEIKRESKNLGALLTLQNVWFRRGTTFPDAAQLYLKGKGVGDSAADQESHNDESPNGGFFTGYLAALKNKCGHDLSALVLQNAGHCQEALAFFFGMLNHAVADGPWHATWIGKTTGNYCPDVEQSWTGNQYRHQIADNDIDICMASRLNGSPFDVTVTVAWSKAQSTANEPKLLCSKGQFFSLAGGGTCWSCPEGYGSSGDFGNSKTACVKPAWGEARKGNKHGKSTVGICPKGQWVSLHDGHCYSCPGGWHHNVALPGNVEGVCYKLHGASFSKASPHGKATFICPLGEFPELGVNSCFKCPSGYSWYPEFIVTDERVCQKRVTAPCSKIKLPVLTQVLSLMTPHGDQAKALADMIATAHAPAKLVIRGLLDQAYKAAGHSVDVAGIDAEMDSFYLNALKEPLAPFSHVLDTFADTRTKSLTAHAGQCSGAFEHVMDQGAKGGIPDSAHEVSKAMAALWQAITKQEQVSFVRTGSFGYSIKVGGKNLYCFGDC